MIIVAFARIFQIALAKMALHAKKHLPGVKIV
jgi:hypothetical protein